MTSIPGRIDHLSKRLMADFRQCMKQNDGVEKSDYNPGMRPLSWPLNAVMLSASTPDNLYKHGAEVKVGMMISGANVISTSHYDLSNNFFFVVRGSKQFYLSPPTELSKYRTHPTEHPFRRQTQLPAPPSGEEEGTVLVTDKTSSVCVPDAIVAQCTCKRGEVLFIPEGWIHRYIHFEVVSTALIGLWCA